MPLNGKPLKKQKEQKCFASYEAHIGPYATVRFGNRLILSIFRLRNLYQTNKQTS